jgi:aldose 1-epimerase
MVCEIFGHLPDGAPVEKVSLRGAGGFEVAVITFGAVVQALHVPPCAGSRWTARRHRAWL